MGPFPAIHCRQWVQAEGEGGALGFCEVCGHGMSAFKLLQEDSEKAAPKRNYNGDYRLEWGGRGQGISLAKQVTLKEGIAEEVNLASQSQGGRGRTEFRLGRDVEISGLVPTLVMFVGEEEVSLFFALDHEEPDLAFRLLSDLGAEDVEKLVKVKDGRVVGISASRRQLKGNIPAELGNLTALQNLDLAMNQLTGEIPTEIHKLTRLRYLNLFDNKLTGPIPKEVGKMAGLTTLWLTGNRLTGQIPVDIGNLGSLEELWLCGNQLAGPIPEIGNMTKLKVLSLSENKLSGPIPASIGRLTSLEKLYLSRNQLTGPIPASMGRLTSLERLLVSENRLTGPIPPVICRLDALQVLSLGSLASNQLEGSIPSEIGDLPNLIELVLTGNKLTGPIPPEVGNLTRLKFLSLARNKLSGSIPAAIGRLTSLEDLALFENQLSGRIPHEIGQEILGIRAVLLHKNFLEGPFHWSNAAGIRYLTLHENRFQGSPPSGLQTMTALDYLTLHGNDFSGTVPKLNLPAGAWATLHRNRFSCQLPASLGLEDVRATVVMGNMVGVGDSITANWIIPPEWQDFLYVSSKVWWGNVLVLAGLPLAFLCAAVIFRQSRQAFSGNIWVLAPDVHASSMQSLQLSLWIAALCALLLPAYLHGARYYECGQPLARSTAAYLDGSAATELFVILVWSLVTLFFSASITALPEPREEFRGPPAGSWLRHKIAWFLWIVPVTMMSLPSILFSVAQALPKDNMLIADSILQIAHRTAPALVVGIDVLLAGWLSIKYAGLSGIRADRLLMSLRLCAAWLLPLLTAVALQENCLAGWKTWWTTCDPDSRMHEDFNWHFWEVSDVEILNTTTDMCSANHQNLWEGRCSRSLIEGLSPLILKKLLIRIALQPLVMVLAWRASKLEDPSPLEESRQLRLLGRKTSGSLASMQQHAYFTTLLETAIVWGPLVPLVSFGVVAAFLANRVLFETGLSFGVRLPTDAANTGAGVSKTYLRFALAMSCVFQLWHAFGTSMAGRTILLPSAMLTTAFSTLGLPRQLRSARRSPRRGPDSDEQEMSFVEGARAGLPLRISLQSAS
ncbi:GSO1 [Symbiodinium sp. KB8]|nr:GSO1 [Symbiodinium sp. KB8]